METQGLLLYSEPSAGLDKEIDIQVASLDASYFSAAHKDSHLVKLALCFHSMIVSDEIRSRRIFCQLSQRFDPLHDVRWVKPHVVINYGFVAGGQSSYPMEWTLSFSN
jgi:hypothetical protein